ncbi:hypothetical protein GCM10020001_032150 [Nonomuraea salmonea]
MACLGWLLVWRLEVCLERWVALWGDGGLPGGEAPLPWEMGVRTKPVKPVAWVSPIDGPKAFPLVVAAIAVLMSGLWLVVTVQKWRNQRKVF